MTYEVRIFPLDLSQTLSCGQTFRWRQNGDRWEGVIGSHFVRLRQHESSLLIDAEPSHRAAVSLVRTHLRADDDIDLIQRRLSSDRVLAGGLKDVRGLRIVKIDEWECLVSFVLATYANIPRITGMVERLCSTFGKEIADSVHAFPDIDELGSASERELIRCGLGYRAKHVHALCSSLTRRDLDRMARDPFDELRAKLIELPGVGEKVADCVLLFGFGRLEAFPIDVWMERALARLYGVRGTYRRLRAFASERFGEYAGYAQEYLYYNERLRKGRGECIFTRV